MRRWGCVAFLLYKLPDSGWETGKLACRDAQTLDGATGMSTQAYAPECECLSGLRECDARGNPQVILFGSAADRRHMGLRDKLEVVSRQIGKEGLPYPMVSVIINLKLKSDVRTVEASYEKSRLV